MDKEVVKELIQNELNTFNIKSELLKITDDKQHRDKLLADYKVLKQKLGGGGASKKTAHEIYHCLNS